MTSGEGYLEVPSIMRELKCSPYSVKGSGVFMGIGMGMGMGRQRSKAKKIKKRKTLKQSQKPPLYPPVMGVMSSIWSVS